MPLLSILGRSEPSYSLTSDKTLSWCVPLSCVCTAYPAEDTLTYETTSKMATAVGTALICEVSSNGVKPFSGGIKKNNNKPTTETNMIKLGKNLSANPEADQLWREFNRRLDKANDDNLLNTITDNLLNRVTDYRYIQCLNHKALAVMIGKIQVLQGRIQMLHGESQRPQKELQVLHAKLQVLCGTMFPYLALDLCNQLVAC